MQGNAEERRGKPEMRVSVAVMAAMLLALPLGAMQFTDEVAWSASDFAVFGVMLIGTLGAYNLATRMTNTRSYRFAVGVALAASFLLVWLSLGVGIIGADGDPANIMYFGVLAVGAAGALATRFQPRGMAGALTAMAIGQSVVTAIALIGGLGRPYSGPLELVGLNGFFVAMFAASAWLFWRAAPEADMAEAA